jgi:hypothetical protein
VTLDYILLVYMFLYVTLYCKCVFRRVGPIDCITTKAIRLISRKSLSERSALFAHRHRNIDIIPSLVRRAYVVLCVYRAHFLVVRGFVVRHGMV